MLPFPDHRGDQRRDADGRHGYDETRVEPIVALAFVEDYLQGAESDGDQAETEIVDAAFHVALFLEVWRVLDQSRGEKQRDNSDRDVDIENPAPTEIVGDVAADRRANCRRENHGHAVYGERHAAFRGGKRVGEDGLLARLKAATARALQNPADDQHREIRGEAAHE